MRYHYLRPARVALSNKMFDALVDIRDGLPEVRLAYWLRPGFIDVQEEYWVQPYFTFEQAQQVVEWYNSGTQRTSILRPTMTMKSASFTSSGLMIVVLTNGAQWRQMSTSCIGQIPGTGN